jgi:hypothetical protein
LSFPPPPDAEEPPPESDPLEGLIERMKVSPGAIFEETVIKAIAALKSTNPVQYSLLIRDLKQFKHDYPKSGFTFELLNAQIKKHERLESALLPGGGAPDIATMLVELSDREDTPHFLSKDTSDAFADIKVEDDDGVPYVATVPVSGRSYGRWLNSLFYDRYKRAAPREAFKAALRTIEARTFAARRSFRLFPRIAIVQDANGDTVIYHDIGDHTGQAIRVDHASIQVVDNPPVKFIRPEGGIGILPIPEPDGDINELKGMLNLRGNRDFILGVAWVLGCYQPQYALLQALLLGRHGSAKTSTMRRLCALIDPILDEPSEPVREDREMILVAQNSYVQNIDNVVKISTTRSAALCRLSTGGTQRGRILYTTADTYTLHARRPVIQTAIRMVVTAPDLIDRTAIVGMGRPFEEEKEADRETERVMEAKFQAAWPKLLGCILKAVSEGLRHRRAGEPVPKPLPRMADFAEWTYRCEVGLGWERGTIMQAYREALTEYAADIAELDTIASGLLRFMLDNPDGWRGSIAMLGAHLNRMDGGRAARSVPRIWDLKELSAAIDELSSVLFRNGLRVSRSRSDGKREVVLDWLPNARPNGKDAAPPSSDHLTNPFSAAGGTWKPQP